MSGEKGGLALGKIFQQVIADIALFNSNPAPVVVAGQAESVFKWMNIPI